MNTRVKRTFLDDWFDQGREKGEMQAALRMVTQLFEHRFGPLGVTWQNRLKRLTLKQLEQLNVALLDFTSQRDLSAWMKEHAN
ncbi:MAG: DUF4351 domain-containing protein [Acidobacteria bacterium]|nr:DUF4351 domain-containing protein [Acidobacteriota bacterium]